MPKAVPKHCVFLLHNSFHWAARINKCSFDPAALLSDLLKTQKLFSPRRRNLRRPAKNRLLVLRFVKEAPSFQVPVMSSKPWWSLQKYCAPKQATMEEGRNTASCFFRFKTAYRCWLRWIKQAMSGAQYLLSIRCPGQFLMSCHAQSWGDVIEALCDEGVAGCELTRACQGFLSIIQCGVCLFLVLKSWPGWLLCAAGLASFRNRCLHLRN